MSGGANLCRNHEDSKQAEIATCFSREAAMHESQALQRRAAKVKQSRVPERRHTGCGRSAKPPYFFFLEGAFAFVLAAGFLGLASLLGFLTAGALAGLLTLAAAAGFEAGTGFAGTASFAAGADFAWTGTTGAGRAATTFPFPLPGLPLAAGETTAAEAALVARPRLAGGGGGGGGGGGATAAMVAVELL